MHVSLHWIKNYVKIPDLSPKELMQAITLSIVEVEEMIDQAKELDGVVVGKILELIKHPQADRLYVCRVDIKSEQLQIICGGHNLQKGMLVAVAKVGSKVKWHGAGERITLESAKIRGVESNGMIAASNELGLEGLFPSSDEREILDLTSYGLRVGESLAKALGLDDSILVIDNKSMTHRPDLWGLYGMARECAALFKTKLKPLAIPAIPQPGEHTLPLEIKVHDTLLCPRYSAIVLDKVTVSQSPWWLRRELEALGVNSINTIVDITNYIMLVLGQPMHAFDYHEIEGHALIIEPMGTPHVFAALNSKEYMLTPEMLMIKDAKKPLAIAGIMGGTHSGITDATKTIVLEVANFNASSIRRSSMIAGLRTEASARFEKKLDPELVHQAMALAVELIQQLSPGATVASPVLDNYPVKPAVTTLTVDKKFIDARLGTKIDAKEITSILKSLAFGVAAKKDVFTITIPTHRMKDITIPEDIVEEIARIYGYANIGQTMPITTIAKPSRDIVMRVEREMKNLLARGFGYNEVYTYSFANVFWSERLDLNRNRVAVKNSLTADQSFLRTSLIPGLIACSVENMRWQSECAVFELGRQYENKPGEFSVDGSQESVLPRQPKMLSGVVASKKRSVDQLYREVKGMLLQLCEYLRIQVDIRETKDIPFASDALELRVHDKTIGSMGLIKSYMLDDTDASDMTIVWWDMNFETLVKYAEFSRFYTPAAKFPSMVRDIAIIIDEGTRWEAIEKTVRHISPIITDVSLFDIFVSKKIGDNKKSLAFSITFQREDRTLESSEIDTIIQRLAKALAEKFNAQIR